MSSEENNVASQNKLIDCVSKVEAQLNISSSENQDLSICDRILRIGINVRSEFDLICDQIVDILSYGLQNTKFIQEILVKIREKLKESLYFPDDIETIEKIKNIRDITYQEQLEPQKLREALQQSLLIHQYSEEKIQYYQKRVADLEEQISFLINNKSSNEEEEASVIHITRIKPNRSRDSEEQMDSSGEISTNESGILKKKYIILAKKYKILEDKCKKLQNQLTNDNDIPVQIKKLKDDLNQKETDLKQFKKAYLILKKKCCETEHDDSIELSFNDLKNQNQKQKECLIDIRKSLDLPFQSQGDNFNKDIFQQISKIKEENEVFKKYHNEYLAILNISPEKDRNFEEECFKVNNEIKNLKTLKEKL